MRYVSARVVCALILCVVVTSGTSYATDWKADILASDVDAFICALGIARSENASPDAIKERLGTAFEAALEGGDLDLVRAIVQARMEYGLSSEQYLAIAKQVGERFGSDVIEKLSSLSPSLSTRGMLSDDHAARDSQLTVYGLPLPAGVRARSLSKSGLVFSMLLIAYGLDALLLGTQAQGAVRSAVLGVFSHGMRSSAVRRLGGVIQSSFSSHIAVLQRAFRRVFAVRPNSVNAADSAMLEERVHDHGAHNARDVVPHEDVVIAQGSNALSQGEAVAQTPSAEAPRVEHKLLTSSPAFPEREYSGKLSKKQGRELSPSTVFVLVTAVMLVVLHAPELFSKPSIDTRVPQRILPPFCEASGSSGSSVLSTRRQMLGELWQEYYRIRDDREAGRITLEESARMFGVAAEKAQRFLTMFGYRR